MKKIAFFDIDGTLWNEHMQVPESTTEAIRELRADGNYAFLCSGRSRSNIRSEKILGIGFDGIVAACGTHIEYEGKKVCERLLTPEEAEELTLTKEKTATTSIRSAHQRALKTL